MKTITISIIFLSAILSACTENKSKKVEESPRKLTRVEETAKDILVNRISKISIKHLTGEESAELSQQVANIVALNPDNIVPLMSYYHFYNENLGLHYKQKDWLKLKFYKDVEGSNSVYYETNYKFTAMDTNSIVYWRNVAVKDNGVLLKEKLGGLLFVLSTELSCVEGVFLKFYLENKETVLCDNINEDFNCSLADGIGAALEYTELERLAKSPVKAIEVIDKASGDVLLLPVDNPYMKKYFIELKKEFDSGL